MEKRNIVEDGRTPDLGVKLAEDLEKAAEDMEFDFNKEHDNEIETNTEAD